MRNTVNDPKSQSGRLQCIDVLRGIAILGVILMHLPHDAPGGYRLNPWFFPAWLMDFGYLGVHLFVLISGFCIHRRAAIERKNSGQWNVSWGSFWLRRFWRLYPPYILAIALSILAAKFLHDRAPSGAEPSAADLLTHGMMIHNLFREFATSLGNGAFWSLGMEEQLYALYALLLFLLRRFGHFTALSAVFCVTLIWRAFWPVIPEPIVGEGLTLGKWYLWPFMFWLHWTLGAIAAEYYFRNLTLPSTVTSTRTMYSFLCLGLILNRNTFQLFASTGLGSRLRVFLDTPQTQIISSLGEIGIAVGLFCLLIMSLKWESTGVFEGSIGKGTAFLGRVSYSLYLTHVPILFVLEQHLPMTGFRLEWPIRTAVYLTVCVVAGLLYYHVVERWFLSGENPLLFRRKRLESRRAVAP